MNLEIHVDYENGMRFTATCDGYTVVTGKGDDGETSRDGMWPAQLFVAAMGMCIGGHVASYCRNHDIPCEDLRLEVARETARAPSRTTRVEATIYLDAELTERQKRAILQVADRCHITNSIQQGVDILCSLGGEALPA
jgi:uncharacterized OsmC-like protein